MESPIRRPPLPLRVPLVCSIKTSPKTEPAPATQVILKERGKTFIMDTYIAITLSMSCPVLLDRSVKVCSRT